MTAPPPPLLRPIPFAVCALSLVASLAPVARADVLAVGPGKRFAKPSAAIAAARAGDVVEVDAAGTYDGDVAVVRAKNLTIRGVGGGRKPGDRPRLDCKGKSADRKGILVQLADNLTVENLEFVGARSPDFNGAGIRAQAPGLVVRRCRFYDCENGILGGAGDVLVEQCEFSHCGHSKDPKGPTHSCYFGHEVARLTFQYNYSTHTLEGHLLKSRARESRVLYNRLTDEQGRGSAVADFPNGGQVLVLGNVLHKGARGSNSQVIMFGHEGLRHAQNALYVVHNTLVYDHRSPGRLARIDHAPDRFRPILRNNLCAGNVAALTNHPAADAAGNVLVKSSRDAGFVDLAKWDLRPRPTSPAVNAAAADPGRAGSMPLMPTFQYAHPCDKEPRPKNGKSDVGALEAEPAAAAK